MEATVMGSPRNKLESEVEKKETEIEISMWIFATLVFCLQCKTCRVEPQKAQKGFQGLTYQTVDGAEAKHQISDS